MPYLMEKDETVEHAKQRLLASGQSLKKEGEYVIAILGDQRWLALKTEVEEWTRPATTNARPAETQSATTQQAGVTQQPAETESRSAPHMSYTYARGMRQRDEYRPREREFGSRRFEPRREE